MPQQKIILALFLLCSSAALWAQKDSSGLHNQTQRFSFHPVIQTGLLEGAQGASLQLGIVGGVQYKTWYAGVGTALDYYGFRSIPLFATVRKNVLKQKPLFVYADAGAHFPWVKTTNGVQWVERDFKAGRYYDAGVGYGFNIAENNTLQLSFGYSQKRLREYRQQLYIWGPAETPIYKERFDYTYRRFSIKAGWMF